MSSCDLAFQQACFVALKAASPGTSFQTQPAVDEAVPYVFLGESQVVDNEIGHELQLTVHSWSAAAGGDEVKGLMETVRSTLHAGTLTKDTWTFTCIREEYANVILDPDKVSWHGVQRFRALASEL